MDLLRPSNRRCCCRPWCRCNANRNRQLPQCIRRQWYSMPNRLASGVAHCEKAGACTGGVTQDSCDNAIGAERIDRLIVPATSELVCTATLVWAMENPGPA